MTRLRRSPDLRKVDVTCHAEMGGEAEDWAASHRILCEASPGALGDASQPSRNRANPKGSDACDERLGLRLIAHFVRKSDGGGSPGTETFSTYSRHAGTHCSSPWQYRPKPRALHRHPALFVQQRESLPAEQHALNTSPREYPKPQPYPCVFALQPSWLPTLGIHAKNQWLRHGHA